MAIRAKAIAVELRNTRTGFVRRVGDLLREEETSRERRLKSLLICPTIGCGTIGIETALQLGTPVWQCNTERLK
jgi:hypothetical protein